MNLHRGGFAHCYPAGPAALLLAGEVVRRTQSAHERVAERRF